METQEKEAVAISKINDFQGLLTFGNNIIKSGLTPLKKGEDVVAAILLGRELGLGEMVSVNNIYSVNGKAAASIHVINALLQKAGVVVEVLHDYEPCVRTVMKGDDGNPVKDEKGNTVILREIFASEIPLENEIKGKIISNYKTVVKFTRQLKQPDGKYKDTSVISSFSYQDSVIAGLNTKDNWKNYPKVMTLNRALAFGGRLIGADILLGLYEVSELADAHNIDYKLEPNGKTTIIIPEEKPIINTTSIEEVKEVSSEN
jgi:hypothetical protein